MLETITSCKPGRPKDPAKHVEIVTAATELFLENGYSLTSMEAVARKAGVSKLTIYSHFADKNELFGAVIQHRCKAVGMPQSFLHEAQMPVDAALIKIALHALAIIYRPDSLRLARIVQGEALRHPEIVEIYYSVGPRRVKAALAELLQNFHNQGKLSISDPVRAAEQFFSVLKGEMLQRVLVGMSPLPTSEQLDTHIVATVDFFLSAYRPSPTSSTHPLTSEMVKS